MLHCTVVITLGNLPSFPSYILLPCEYDIHYAYMIMQFYYTLTTCSRLVYNDIDYSELVYLRAVRSCSVPWMSSRYSPPTFDRNRKTNSGSGCRPFWTAFFTHKMTAKNYGKKSTSSTLSMESKYELIKKYFYCMIPSL